MEASFFRFLTDELRPVLEGVRIEKIFGPGENVWTLRLGLRGERKHLLFRPAKSAGLLFLSGQKPANPFQAPARVMWFRKRVAGRIILSTHADWANLRLALRLTPRKEPGHGTYLILDIREGLFLRDELEPGYDTQTDWPELSRILDDREVWRDYPHLSPPLRKVLRALPAGDAQSLLQRLKSGTAGQFFVSEKTDPKAAELPPEKRLGLSLVWQDSPEPHSFDSAIDAAAYHGERVLFPYLEQAEANPELSRLKAKRKKVRRAMAKLEQDAARLQRMMDGKTQAEALQAELYRFKGVEDVSEVEVTHPEHGVMTVPLDPQLSPTQNMERLFKKAAKAERGFVHLARRRNELGKELARLEAAPVAERERIVRKTDDRQPPSLPKKYRGLAVSCFLSSDGFLLIRGKNKKANHDILSKAASPFDYWFHAKDGPSSHLILKRDYPNQDVPLDTLRQAAALVGLKSFHKDSGRAEVMFALVKDVRKVKGWAHGQVAVDEILGTVVADLAPELENRLQWKPPRAD